MENLKCKNKRLNLINIEFQDRFYWKTQNQNAVQFDADVPEYMHILRHTSRSAIGLPAGSATKCFHNTDKILTLHNHYALECTIPCFYYDVSEGDAMLNHYRKDCKKSEGCKLIDSYVRDDRVDIFKNKLITRSLSALLQLGFVKEKARK